MFVIKTYISGFTLPKYSVLPPIVLHMDKHLQSAMRIAACRADRLKDLSHPSLIEDDGTNDSHISEATNALFRRIGRHMFTVFNDAKRGTLSACLGLPVKLPFNEGSTLWLMEIFRALKKSRTTLDIDSLEAIRGCLVSL